jgi:hypothetical protein
VSSGLLRRENLKSYIVLLLYYCHRAKVQLQFNKYIYIFPNVLKHVCNKIINLMNKLNKYLESVFESTTPHREVTNKGLWKCRERIRKAVQQVVRKTSDSQNLFKMVSV